MSGRSWLKAGFRVVEINMQTEKVVFGRDAPAPGTALPPGRGAAPRAGSTPPPTSPAPPATRQRPPATTARTETDITEPPTWDPLIALAKRRPVFHSEADFQFELAWTLRETGYTEIRIEKPVAQNNKRIYIDIYAVEPGGRRLAIELKYWTRTFKKRVHGEEFDLVEQGAQDISRYDFWKDVSRVEQVVAKGDADAGYAIALTLDPAYLRPPSRTTIDEAFRMHERRDVPAGPLAWGIGAGEGTVKGRKDPIPLGHDYHVRWARYAEEGPVWCLVLEVPSWGHPA